MTLKINKYLSKINRCLAEINMAQKAVEEVYIQMGILDYELLNWVMENNDAELYKHTYRFKRAYNLLELWEKDLNKLRLTPLEIIEEIIKYSHVVKYKKDFIIEEYKLFKIPYIYGYI